MRERYEEQIDIQTARLAGRTKRFLALGYLKIALVALLAITIYLAVRSGGRLGVILTAAGLFLVFCWAWYAHIKVQEEVARCKGIISVQERYLQRMDGKWQGFAVKGEECGLPSHPYSRDLDMVGEGSLYQMLCVAHTPYGLRAFGTDLLSPGYSVEQIRQRQRAVVELTKDVVFAGDLEYATSRVSGGTVVEDAIADLEEESLSAPDGVLGALIRWVPVGVTFLLAVAAVAQQWRLVSLLMLVAAAQATLWAACFARTERFLRTAAKAPYAFHHYEEIFERIGQEKWESPLLTRIQGTLSAGKESASKAVKELDSIVSMTQIKGSGLPYFLLNAFLLWDLRCAVRLGRWKKDYGRLCRSWFVQLGQLESLLSLACLGNVCRNVCIPVIVESKRELEAEGLGHPLLPNGERVCNSLSMQGEIYILSGSNMSGKTTFLRTVGINLVLARAGGFVCAGSMRTFLFEVVSSMRVTDNLGEGISSFYAELRQIKAVIEKARNSRETFFLVDEIFRGTNSEDRLYGAGQVIRELCRLDVMGMVTTHDLSLCALEEECENLRNFNFMEQYRGEEMCFDYCLRPGKSKTTNARFLMKQVGLL